MIILHSEYFKLDITHLGVKFSELNGFFDNQLAKQQSFPFSVELEQNTIEFFEFFQSHNYDRDSNLIDIILQIKDEFYKAELLVTQISESIEMVIYYNVDELDIFNENLKDLDWGSLEFGDDIFDYINNTVKSDPKPIVNFPMVKHEGFEDGEYLKGSEYFNEHDGTNITEENVGVGVGDPFYRDFQTHYYVANEVRPYIRIEEIVKKIFDTIGYTITGNFTANLAFQKAFQYHQESIYYQEERESTTSNIGFTAGQTFNSGTYSGFTEYNDQIALIKYGSYFVSIDFNVTLGSGDKFWLFFVVDGVVVSPSTAGTTITAAGNHSYTVKFSFELSNSLPEDKSLQIRIITSSGAANSFTHTTTFETIPRFLYPRSLLISTLLPDMRVIDYWNAVKEAFVLETTFDPINKTVQIDSLFESFKAKQAVDLSKYQPNRPLRKLANELGFFYSFNDFQIYIDKLGNYLPPQKAFKELSFQLQPIKLIGTIAEPTAVDESGLKIIFSDNRADGLPAINSVDGSDVKTFTQKGFIYGYRLPWDIEVLNAEDYQIPIILPVYESAKIKNNSKLWMYNNYFLVKEVKKTLVSRYFERCDIKMFKMIGKLSEPTSLDPIAKVTSVSNPYSQLDHESSFATTGLTDALGGKYYNITLYNNGSYDPKHKATNRYWSFISGPGGVNSSIEWLNEEKSSVRVSGTHSTSVAGIYTFSFTIDNGDQSTIKYVTVEVIAFS